MKYRVDKCMVLGVENGLNCYAHSVVISGPKSGWKPVTYIPEVDTGANRV